MELKRAREVLMGLLKQAIRSACFTRSQKKSIMLWEVTWTSSELSTRTNRHRPVTTSSKCCTHPSKRKATTTKQGRILQVRGPPLGPRPRPSTRPNK